MNSSAVQCTRRAFLLAAGVAVPAAAFAATGRPNATGRFATGHVGLGRRGAALLHAPELDPRGFFDVDAAQVKTAAPPARAGAQSVASFAELLNLSDADAIVIATPDHWHADMAISACEAGKDVYLETPCIWQPRQAARLLEAARRWGVVVQTGELLPYTRAGVVLKERLAAASANAAITATCTFPANPVGGAWESAGPPPAGFNWFEWLGPAEGRPFNADYAHVNWRYMLDWGGGHIRSHGTPLLATLLWALELESPRRVTVEASGDAPTSGLWQCPPRYTASIQIDDRLHLDWRQEADAAPATTIEGAGDRLLLQGDDERAALTIGDAGATHTGWDGPSAIGHWAHAMTHRTPPRLSLTTACNAAIITQLAVLSWRLRAKLTCDLNTLTVEGNPLATRILQAAP